MQKSLLSLCLITVTTSLFALDMPAQPNPQNSMPERKEMRQERFMEHKQHILERLHQTEQCVQAAQTPQELKSCRPKKQEMEKDRPVGDTANPPMR